MADKGIARSTGAAGKRVAEGHEQHQRESDAETPGVARRQIRPGKAGFKRANGCGHAAAVFLPKRASKRVCGFDMVVLDRDRLVGDPVFRFQPGIDLGAGRRPVTAQRPERCGETSGEENQQKYPHPVRHDPEDAEPGKRQKQCDNAQ